MSWLLGLLECSDMDLSLMGMPRKDPNGLFNKFHGLNDWELMPNPRSIDEYEQECKNYLSGEWLCSILLKDMSRPHSFNMPLELRQRVLVLISDRITYTTETDNLFSAASPQTGSRTKAAVVAAKKEDIDAE